MINPIAYSGLFNNRHCCVNFLYICIKIIKMSLGHYIKELLDDHDYVVLPGFGAFILNITEARFVEKNTRLLPPSRKISFNPDIKQNDGILLNHFAHRERLTAAKAHLRLAQICEDIRYRLDHNETVEIEELGVFKRQGGQYSFSPSKDSENWPGASGLEPVEISFRNDPPFKAAPVSMKLSGKEAHKRESTMKYYWFLVLPVLALILIFMLSPREDELIVPENNTLTEEPVFHEKQIVQEEMTPEAEDDPTEADIKEVLREPTHPANDLYYLVGGSFKTRENAEQYYKKMKEKGYQPLHIGEIRNFHIVAIAFYTSEREAVRAQNTILSQDSTSGVWVYHSSGND
jgi:nucleoid DNA-binding protein